MWQPWDYRLVAKQSRRQRFYQATLDCWQFCDSKQISCSSSVLLQETNLLPRFNGHSGDKYHGNPPNIMVIRRICWIFAKYSCKYLSLAIELIHCLHPGRLLFPVTTNKHKKPYRCQKGEASYTNKQKIWENTWTQVFQLKGVSPIHILLLIRHIRTLRVPVPWTGRENILDR